MTGFSFKAIALFGQTKRCCKFILHICTVVLMIGIQFAHAQAGLSDRPPSVLTQPPQPLPLPARIQKIRTAQIELARTAGIQIMQHEFGERSSTGLGGVPPEFQDRTIATEFDLISGIEALYPYYGFSGSETLEYEDQRNVFGHTQYHFRQYIDGIETSQPVTIYVDNQSKRVMRIPGSPQIDRLVDRTPRLTAQQAIDIAVRYVQQSEDSRADLYNLNGAHDAEFVYQNSGPDGTLVPYWRVQLAISERFPGAAGESLLVGPNGEVDTGRITVR